MQNEKPVHDRRPKIHNEKKTTHNRSVTPAEWKGVQETAQIVGYRKTGRKAVSAETETDVKSSLKDALVDPISKLRVELESFFEAKCDVLLEEIKAAKFRNS